MYLPRSLISNLYLHLQRTNHPLSPPVLILVALEPDALCGCRILTQLLKRDYIPHKIQPIAGYSDLEKAGRNVIHPMMESQGGSGGVVVCLGVGGLVDLGGLLGIDTDEDEIRYGGVEVWVIDARRPWNLGNVYGGHPQIQPTADGTGAAKPPRVEGGQIQRDYKPGKGGIIVFDDGDIETDLEKERDAYLALVDMPEVEENDEDSDGSETEGEDDRPAEPHPGQKRKSWSDRDDEDGSEDEDDRPRQRRRSNSSSPIPDSPTRPKQRGLISLNGPPKSSSAVSRSVSPSPSEAPKGSSARTLRRRLLKLRRKNELILQEYYSLGASYSEPISSMMYSLASALGRTDNDLLWMTIVGVTSMELYGRSSIGVAVSSRKSTSSSAGWLGNRGSRTRQLLRDEVRRHNPPELADSGYNSNRNMFPENCGIIPTTARSPTDTSIRLSPEPKFLLIRHWSLYDSMLHSPYLSARLHIWSDSGRKRLHKLLAKMGVSLVQCKQSYTHMDMELKRGLRTKLLKYSEMYGLDDLVPSADTDGKDRGGTKEGWGFVRSWGWRATLSAQDVGVVVGAILEVGRQAANTIQGASWDRGPENKELSDEDGTLEGEEWVGRFWDAYDALEKIEELKAALPTAQHLHRAILRTGTSLIEKRQIRHLRAFRMCIVKDGPDVALFTHPAALTKLALWVGGAIAEQEKESKGKLGHGGRGTPLVVAGLNENRGVYVIIGTGGGGGGTMGFGDKTAAKEKKEKQEVKAKARELKRQNKEKIRLEKKEARRKLAGDDEDEDDETESEGSDSSSDEDDEYDEASQVNGFGRNKFGNAFQEVVEETNARVRIDSFEHCVVEVKKEDLSGFLESLSMKAVVG
ncbi:CDC45 family [Amylocarpus encephaloides]|uniref:CDC45 family n=1 Tax=Amylocarpus encephaloides TaxID=45428 RepID=A0A9P7YMY2_9HELO|nr:CDC45 family [Amylocarpus encephaloides]